ncbi:MAG: cysteine desulfuration protein SufE [Hyphomicrobiales bacterium]|nr:MAG: cysteine desulfuration protein SufE [Hyphomicrobiales bacterium]
MDIDEILDNFSFLEEWDDRYRYLVELGRDIEPLPETERTDTNKVLGCVSQVWLSTSIDGSGDSATLTFIGDSDAHIVRGLLAILIAMCSGKTAAELRALDLEGTFRTLGLEDHLTPQRANGLKAMIQRVRADAERARAA